MPRRSARPRLLAATAVALLFLLTGCESAIKAVSVEQPETAGPVRIVTDLCAGDGRTDTTDDSDACLATSNMEIAGAALAAYEVAEGTEPVSSTLTITSGGTPTTHTLTRNASYEAWLEADDAAAEGRDWVGFQGPPIGIYDGSEAARSAQLVTVFKAPQGSESFPYRTVLRNRSVHTPTTAATPVDCTLAANCQRIDRLPTVALAGTWTLRDASVSAGDPVVAERGTAVFVPFTVRYAGAGASEAFRAWSSTSLPGADTRASSPVVFPAAGDSPTAVAVTVPADAPTGLHDVTLRIELPGGATREATGKIEVVAPAAAKQTEQQQQQQEQKQEQEQKREQSQTIALTDIRAALAKLKLTSSRRATLRGKGIRFRQEFLTGGRVTWTVKAATGKKALLGRAARTVAAAGTESVVLKLRKAGRRALARRGLKRLTLTTAFVDAGGRKASAKKTIRVR